MKFAGQRIEKYLKLKTPGVLADDYMSEAGRKILSLQFVRMISHEPGTRLGADAEELHDMRVATRRMRVGLEFFGPFFKKKAISPYLKGLRGTARALGRVRDLDVYLGNLNNFLKSLPEEERLGYGILISQWKKKHKNAQLRMRDFLDSDRYQLFTQQFGLFLNNPGEGSKQRKAIQPNQVRDHAPMMIYERLAAVQPYGKILGYASVKELHSLRIELKKLRYVIEFFHDVLGPESKEVIRNIKVLQDHLGNLNDADVACQITNGFIAKLEKEQLVLPVQERVNPKFIFIYLSEKYDERHYLISTFYEAWHTIMDGEFSEKLAKAISLI